VKLIITGLLTIFHNPLYKNLTVKLLIGVPNVRHKNLFKFELQYLNVTKKPGLQNEAVADFCIPS